MHNTCLGLPLTKLVLSRNDRLAITLTAMVLVPQQKLIETAGVKMPLLLQHNNIVAVSKIDKFNSMKTSVTREQVFQILESTWHQNDHQSNVWWLEMLEVINTCCFGSQKTPRSQSSSCALWPMATSQACAASSKRPSFWKPLAKSFRWNKWWCFYWRTSHLRERAWTWNDMYHHVNK